MTEEKNKKSAGQQDEFPCFDRTPRLPARLIALQWCILLIGLHSVLLGLFVYFATDTFYRIFFNARPENLFFVRQSGVFLFLSGLFYFYPLKNLKALGTGVQLILFAKVTAVIFLLSNAHLMYPPLSVYLAALGDGMMATALGITYLACLSRKCLP